MPRTYWTPYQIVLTLQNAQEEQGCPYSYDNRSLYNRAHELFGSWERVLSVAGLDQEQPWSTAHVVELLQQRFPQQASEVWNDLALTVAAARLFGDCDHALLAAGFHINRPYALTNWSAEQVKTRIRERYRSGRLLETVKQEDPELFYGACAHFGNWRQAVSASHLCSLRPAWSKHQIIQTLKELERKGTLRAHEDFQLYAMCRRQFGTWRDALLAAGIKARIPHNWPRERIVQELRNWVGRDEGRIQRDDPCLYQAAIRHFKNWPAAQKAAGLPSSASNQWSKERIMHELRRWHKKCEDGCFRLDSKLRAAARRYFGNVEEALAAAGLSFPVGGKRWTPKRVIIAIQDQHVRGLQIQQPYGIDQSLADAAKRLFGSWQAALIASGLGSEYKPRPGWTKERLIKEIQRRHQQGRRMSQNANRDLAYFVRRQFGHWKHATKASGLTPKDLGFPCYMTREELIGVIQERHREGHSMRAEDNRDLFPDVRRVLGGWVNAQLAAGLEPSYIFWTRARLVTEIRNRLRQGPIPFDDRIRSAARRHFGTWRKALIAAGLDEKDIPCRVRT